MESADFKRWVNLRQNRRSQVTLIFNDQSSFDSLSHLQKKIEGRQVTSTEGRASDVE